ncbi:MAG: AcvB/VirJ family lysyl-phosphatidylglycerol hydrolase, partial [Luteimonas sp.]
MRTALALMVLAALQAPVSALAAPPATETISHGRFVDVPIRRPKGAVQRFVLWFEDGATSPQRERRSAALATDGAMVATVDVRRLERALAKEPGACVFGAGDVENFARYVQAYDRLPTYFAPILVGDGEGAALAYAINAEARSGTVAGSVSLGFCPVFALPRALCSTADLKIAPGSRGGAVLSPTPVRSPVAVSSFGVSNRCATLARHFLSKVPGVEILTQDASNNMLPAVRNAVKRMGAQRDVSVPPAPKDLIGLPIVEVPAVGSGNRDTFAVFVSGDGGWAGFDKDVAASLAATGMPVAGIDSLRYFWTPRTPESFAVDLDRVVRYYAAHWRRPKVVVIGFSQGADVLPATINRLPVATRKNIALTALLSVGMNADFEFHLSNWLGGSGKGRPIAPEVARMESARTLCVYGTADKDALCPHLAKGEATVVALPGDHHFG